MRRKIYDRLLEWKERDKGSCALLLDGARRVGKSYIAEQFGRNEYKSYIVIDFARLPQEVRMMFENGLYGNVSVKRQCITDYKIFQAQRSRASQDVRDRCLL